MIVIQNEIKICCVKAKVVGIYLDIWYLFDTWYPYHYKIVNWFLFIVDTLYIVL